MPTFQECLKTRSSPFTIKKSKQTLHEGMELSASELLDELTAPQVHSISATVVADNVEALTILLQVNKWNSAINKTANSFTPHPQTNACTTTERKQP